MKNFTNNFKLFTSRLSARWLIMALMMLVGTSSAWAGTNWQGKIYFKAPDSWNLSTNSKVQIVLTQSSSASSGTKYAYVVGTMEKVTGSDRLYFYSSINTNHSSWGDEYIAFIANSATWNTGDYYISSCAHYTKPSSYKANNSGNYYLYKATTESSTVNNESLSGSYNSDRRTILNEAQTINLKTDGSSSGLGGKVKITGYYDTADKTLQSSTDETDGTANDKSIGYADAAIGSKITLVATPSTSYKFDGWYDDKGALVSSNTSYSYNVHSQRILEARFSKSCTPPDEPIFDAIPAQCGSYTLPTEDKNKVKVNWYNANGNEITSVTQSGTYYAEAVDGTCVSENRTDVEITINPKPSIGSITQNVALPVPFEDVVLTATDVTPGAEVKWYKGNVVTPVATGTTYIVTSENAGEVTVKAKAFLGDCESDEVSHPVTFSAENCNSTTTTEQQTVGKIKVMCKKPSWIGGSEKFYCYAWVNNTSTTLLGGWPGTELTQKDGDYYYVVVEANNKNIKIILNDNSEQTVDSDVLYANNVYKISATSTKSGDKYTFTNNTFTSQGTYTEPVEVTVDPEITAPAAKTISVSTTDGEGNIIFSGQVVKTGCDATNEYGFQYSLNEQTWTTVKVGENAVAGTAISNNTVKGLDGTYYVRAYITNDNSTQFGAIKEITVSTEKEPITKVTLTHVRNQAGDSYSDQELENLTYCVGDIVWFKLEQDGSNFQEYEWISYPGTELTGMYDGGMFKFKITESGNVGIRLRNEANVVEGKPTWVESNLLEFKTHTEPTAPYISINPASGVLCEGKTATITVTNPSTDCAYKLVEERSKAGFTDYESGDLTYTVGSVGKYYVAAQHIACRANEYTSNQVEINQIISTSASISIDPANPETTPWEPVTITVNPEEGYVYELSYTDNNLAGVNGVIIKQNGDSYTYYIPRPNSWGTGDSNSRTTIGYGIKAQLKVDGEASQCDLNYATVIIQLKDEDNEDCE